MKEETIQIKANTRCFKRNLRISHTSEINIEIQQHLSVELTLINNTIRQSATRIILSLITLITYIYINYVISMSIKHGVTERCSNSGLIKTLKQKIHINYDAIIPQK